jgi:hypothetical protein
MGFYDTFHPTNLACPFCGTMLADCQGKPEGCRLYIWREGLRHPIAQTTGAGHQDRRLGHLVLDRDVEIYGDCPGCKRWLEAVAVVRDQIWCDTVPNGTVCDCLPVESRVVICGSCNTSFERRHAGRYHACPHCEAFNRMAAPAT